MDQAGNQIPGLFSTITPLGGTRLSGGTPFAATVPIGASVDVQIQNYQNFIFSYWSDGTTDSPKRIVATGDITLTGVFGTQGLPVPPPPPAGQATLLYATKGANGAQLPGMFVTISFGGQVVSRFSPTYVYVPIGAQVTIAPTNSATNSTTGVVSTFDHWEDDPTAPHPRTVTVTANMTLVAIYAQTGGTAVAVATANPAYESTSAMGGTSGFR